MPTASESPTEIFTKLFAESRHALQRYIRRFVGSSETAKEIVQEAFLRTYRQRDSVTTLRAILFSTARNVAMTPPQCPTTEAPGPYFQKEFFHNGYIKSLKQLVHFYNTRDVYPFKVTSGHCPEGKTEKVDCWPMPEVPNNIDMTVGNLGVTDQEENQIVTFLQTLTDGFTTPYPDINTFTGQCMTGGNASTQGNEFLIPTPPLPPCAPAICGEQPLPAPHPIP